MVLLISEINHDRADVSKKQNKQTCSILHFALKNVLHNFSSRLSCFFFSIYSRYFSLNVRLGRETNIEMLDIHMKPPGAKTTSLIYHAKCK